MRRSRRLLSGGAGFDGVTQLRGRNCRSRSGGRNRPGRDLRRAPAPALPPSATAPAAGLEPSLPSVPALSTAIFFPAIFSTQSSTKAELRPPTPSPVTGELTSPSAMTATRRPGFALAQTLETRRADNRRLCRGPIVGGVVANGDAVRALRRLDARARDRSCRSEQQHEVTVRECRDRRAWAFPGCARDG